MNGQDVPNADQAELTLTWAQLNAVGITEPGQYEVTLTARDRFAGTNPQNPNEGIGTARQTIEVVLGPSAIGEASPARTGCENQVTFSAAGSRANGPSIRLWHCEL